MLSSDIDIVARLSVAVLLGAAIGLERTLAGKHAGLRTYALVSLGSCLFVLVGILSSYQLSLFPGLNPVQIAASIVIGIGFIGAGLVAIRSGEHVELTTAAGIWVVAGVGMAAGFGLYIVALAATIIAILVFSLLLRFENVLRRRFEIENE